MANLNKTGYIYHCSYCKKEIYIAKHRYNKHKHFYCDDECKSKHQKEILSGNNNPNFKGKTYITICDQCKCSFLYREHYKSKYKYCSQKCKSKHQREILIGENNPNFKSIECSCSHCKTKIKRTPNYIESHNEVFCSKQCYYEWMSIHKVGINNHNYNSNIPQEERIYKRLTDGYTNWRSLVFKRDSYSCVCCADSRGGNLMAHHLDGYNWCVEKRTDVNNGVTLCKNCHIKFHKCYGYGNNTKKQFEEFMLNYNKDI